MLVHGIRTRAPWQEAIRDVLEAEGFTVVLTNYDYFDIFRFVAPFIILRRKPENILAKQLRIIRSIHPSAQISIIAHSFGTYRVSNILRDDPISKFNRMIYR